MNITQLGWIVSAFIGFGLIQSRPFAASAADVTWDGGGSPSLNWSTLTNWSDDGDPAGDAIIFDNTGAAVSGVTSIVDTDLSISSLAYRNNYVYNPLGATVQHTTQVNSGRTLTVTGGLTVGPTVGDYTETDVTISGSTPGTGALAVNGGNIVVGTDVIWNHPKGVLNLHDLGSFTANIGNLDVAYTQPYGAATLRLAVNNTITADNLRMGRWGSYDGFLYLGQNNTLNIDNIYISGLNGYNGMRSTVAFDSGLSNPTVTIRDKAGTGRVNLISVGDRPTVDNPSEKNFGTLNFSGGSVDVLVNELVVGSAGGRAAAGNSEEGIGSLTMTAGTIDATTLRVGRQTKAGNWNNARGTVNLNGGTIIADSVIIGDQQVASGGSLAYGTITLNGGTVRAASMAGGGAFGGSVSFLFNNGTLANKAGTDLTVGLGVPIKLATTADHNFVADAGRTVTINGAVTSTAGGPFVKGGAGAVVLNGANTYAGQTLVNLGSLIVNGTHAGGGPYIVASGATLGGSGTISGSAPVSIQNGGTASPGQSLGTLTVPSLVLQAGGTYRYEAYDLLAVTGQLTLSNDWVLAFAQNGRLADGGSLTLFTFGTTNAAPDAFDLTPVLVGTNVTELGFVLSSPLNLSVTGNSLTLTGLQLIPEPGTLLLLALGATIIGCGREPRRAH